MIEHENCHASKRKAEPEHVAGKVSGVKTFGNEKGSGDRGNCPDYANNERPLLHDLRHGRGHEFRFVDGGRGHLDSPSTAAGGAICGKVAPLPISLYWGAGEGTACPAGMSAEVAF